MPHNCSVFGIGASINILATFATSFLDDIIPFTIVYGFIGGFGIGFAVIYLYFSSID